MIPHKKNKNIVDVETTGREIISFKYGEKILAGYVAGSFFGEDGKLYLRVKDLQGVPLLVYPLASAVEYHDSMLEVAARRAAFEKPVSYEKLVGKIVEVLRGASE